MKCEKCKKNEATFFYEESVNGKSRSYHLCADCAAELRESGELRVPEEDAFGLFPSFHYPDLLGGLFGLPQSAPKRGKTCPSCGAAWADIAAAGKVSCPDCYRAFGEELADTVRSLHGNVTHTGRAPARRRAVREKENRLADLKEKLKRAIADENFEEAAKLRDEIRALGE